MRIKKYLCVSNVIHKDATVCLKRGQFAELRGTIDAHNQEMSFLTSYCIESATQPVSVLPGKHSGNRSSLVVLLACLTLLFGIMPLVQANVVYTTLFIFDNTNGASPTSLIQGADGNFYGTATFGGSNGGFGTVFQYVTNNNTLNTVFSFNNTNGFQPMSLIQASNGNFFGTTLVGGDFSLGTIFELDTNNVFHSLLSFDGTNGSNPQSALTLNPADGNYYGTTLVGGTNGNFGTVYRLTPDGVFTSIFSFNSTNGSTPYGRLVVGHDGNLYGTTYLGGTNNNNGTVYRITTGGVLTNLISFDFTTMGSHPYTGLLLNTNGLLDGMTTQGGTNGNGALFQITTNGSLNVLISFDGTNGGMAFDPLLQTSNGDLLAPTVNGGTNDNGTIFKLSAGGAFTNLFSFGGTNSSGTDPFTQLIPVGAQSYYGATGGGGLPGSFGTLYKIDVFAPLAPTLSASRNATNNLVISWNTIPGQTQQLQSCSNLFQKSWTNVGGPLLASNTVTSVTFSNNVAPALFYRVFVSP